ncbi:class C sortase [Oribacterium sp. FC2011]|uniref:class C sortase n=1 Tax=Oribacterium sp. FC2011 TaxID=1408311 RepID=UPI000678ED1C|nr:class C sortase [Oribacterium sp. FC2011]
MNDTAENKDLTLKDTDTKTAKSPKKKKGSLTSNIITVIIVLVMIVGIGLLLYPTISEKWNALHQSRAISGYTNQLKTTDVGELKKIRDLAIKYNEDLLSKADRYNPSDEEMEEYMSTLDINGSGIMGYITIPKIDVELPIYHTTDEAVLQIGVGHIVGTSLPVGGDSTHAVLSGHRGLPSAKLFTRLDEVGEGDCFFLHILDKVLVYQVDNINIVLPEEANMIDIVEGKDYCTLITCTPYGINTHRMLVRGEHTETITEEEYKATYEKTSAAASTVTSDNSTMDQGRAIPDWVPIAFAVCAVLILGFALFAPVKKKEKKDKKTPEKENNSSSEQ